MLNGLYAPGGLSVAQLADLGARRVSLGSLLFRASLLAVARTAESVRRGAVEPESALPT